MAWPPDRADLPALQLLHVSGDVGLLAPRCSSRQGALLGDCGGMNLRSCGAELPIEVAGVAA
jgi:hypothetical protein